VPAQDGFTATEIATINGAYLIVRGEIYALGDEFYSKWNEGFQIFEARAPDLTLAQSWMLKGVYSGICRDLFVISGKEWHISFEIGRSYVHYFPNAENDLIGRQCLAAREAFTVFLSREEE
jgi:hypothetical protein